MNKSLVLLMLALGIALANTNAVARRGADDPASHIRQGRGADDGVAGNIRQCRGCDDPAGHVRGGRQDDNEDSNARGRGRGRDDNDDSNARGRGRGKGGDGDGRGRGRGRGGDDAPTSAAIL